MSRTMIDRSQRAIFGARFSEQFKKWKSAGENRTQASFGNEIGASRVSVSKWCDGENIPTPERLKQICKIFGVPEDYFDTTNATHDELYKYSDAFQMVVGKSHVDFAKQIDLNLNLVEALSKVVNFDELFPLYSPISHKVKTGVYDRKVNHMDSATMGWDKNIDMDLHFLQIKRDGKCITFHKCDLAFLKEVQDQIVTFTEYLFHRRQKEMNEEEEKFNQDLLDQGLIEVTVDGEPVPDSEKEEYMKKYREQPMKFGSGEEFENARKEIIENKSGSKKICVTQKEIPENFVLEHDRFAKHFEKIFPDKRKATQEDWDRLFDGDVTLKDGGKATTKEGVK